ncbi:MAG TPA: hypothetical protein VN794_21390 [Methylomirabilota bacterium]|nr:hypothetical protein [Methylomirabilota bacterium]
MKVLLHNTETDLYFLGPDNMWTNDPEKAMNFEIAERAKKQAQESSLKDVELIVSFTGGGHAPMPVERIRLSQ